MLKSSGSGSFGFVKMAKNPSGFRVRVNPTHHYCFGLYWLFIYYVRVTNSGGSGLPEPENPTGFGPFLQTRSYPNPNFLQFREPGTTRTRSFQDFSNPKLPEPEIQTRGYPTGLENLKIAQKILKIAPKIPQFAQKLFKVVPKIAVASRHSCCVCVLGS